MLESSEMRFAVEDDFSEDYSSEKSDEGKNDEDGIDSDIEIALYSQIHYAKDFSFEIVQNTFTEPKINLESGLSSTKSRTFNKMAQGDVKNPIILSNTSSDSDEVKVISEVKHANTVVPEVIIFSNKNSVNSKCRNKNSWSKEFVSINFSSDEEQGVKACKKQKVTNTNFILNSSNKTENFQLKQTFFVENSTKSNLTASLTNHNIDSNSSEDVFMYPCSSKDDISINLALNSSGKLEKYNGQIWHISDQDLYPDQTSRYYNKMDNIICRNCSKRGHRVKDCDKSKKEMVCFLCGFSGHIAIRCPTRSCERCFSTKHRTKKCKVQVESLQLVQNCKVCHFSGHKQVDCPDFWRRYHLTTDDKCIVHKKKAVNNNIYCYNCGKEGHFGYQCYRSRLSNGIFPTSPLVVNYNNPYKNLKSKRKKDNVRKFVEKQMTKIGEKQMTKIGEKQTTKIGEKQKKKIGEKQKKKKKKKKKKSKCFNNSATQAKADDSVKHLQNVTDYVNLLHLPKGKSKNQKRWSIY